MRYDKFYKAEAAIIKRNRKEGLYTLLFIVAMVASFIGYLELIHSTL